MAGDLNMVVVELEAREWWWVFSAVPSQHVKHARFMPHTMAQDTLANEFLNLKSFTFL